jgi:hypothetical protein
VNYRIKEIEKILMEWASDWEAYANESVEGADTGTFPSMPRSVNSVIEDIVPLLTYRDGFEDMRYQVKLEIANWKFNSQDLIEKINQIKIEVSG